MTADPLSGLHHDGSRRYVVPEAGRDVDRLGIGDVVRLRVRAGLDAPIDRLFLRTAPDGEQAFTELRHAEDGPAARWWEATIRVSMPATGYRFLVVTPRGHRWLNGAGISKSTPTDRDDFVLLAGYDAPTWVADRVFYQVLPDRFANGDPANDVAPGAWTYRGHAARRAAWDTVPARVPGGAVEFYGGDLAGIAQRLGHLDDLGVNALYLNPVFDSRSYHGYDTTDYERVADHLGGNAGLAALRRATVDRDVRLMLDIAPNHTGVEHPWFRAAQGDPNAPTAGYYVFRRHPDEYETWLGVAALPKLDYRSRGLREAMYEGRDAVLRRWLREPFSIDGWRIDVANMLGRLGPDQLGTDVARGMRSAVKGEAPDAYLVGEHWFDATDQLRGDQWDGVMSYAGFATPVAEWLAGLEHRSHASGVVHRSGPSSTRALVQTLASFRAAIPWSVARHQFNLVGSHDTPRIRSVVRDDDGRLRAAFGLLLTYVGVPSILYGDEVGLRGADDAEARRTMPWERTAWDEALFDLVRRLVRLRTASEALRHGGFQVLDAGRDVLAYLRDTDDEWVVVVVARAAAEASGSGVPVRHGAIPDGVRFTEALTGRSAVVAGGVLPMPVVAAGVSVWVGRDR